MKAYITRVTDTFYSVLWFSTIVEITLILKVHLSHVTNSKLINVELRVLLYNIYISKILYKIRIIYLFFYFLDDPKEQSSPAKNTGTMCHWGSPPRNPCLEAAMQVQPCATFRRVSNFWVTFSTFSNLHNYFKSFGN